MKHFSSEKALNYDKNIGHIIGYFVYYMKLLNRNFLDIEKMQQGPRWESMETLSQFEFNLKQMSLASFS